MAKNRLSQAAARPARTAIQAVPSGAITEFVDAFLYDMTDRQYAALVVMLTLAFGYMQVLLENWKGIALFRKVPEPSAPVVDEGGVA